MMTRKLFFLFLTVSLASCTETNTKSDALLLDNIIVMEDQVQRMNLIQMDRGNAALSEVKSEYFTSARNENIRPGKIKYLMDKMEEIDRETASIMALIESCKMELLKAAGENIQENKYQDLSSIVWRKYDPVSTPNQAARLNLSAIKHKSDTKTTTEYFTESEKIPSDKGMRLWDAFSNYRLNLVKSVGTYNWSDKSFKVIPVAINSYSDYLDLVNRVRKMIEGSNANVMEDEPVLITLYINLTKPEKQNYPGNNTHWINATFKDSPLVNTLATLSSMQQDILSARAMALMHWKSKISICGYDFNSIIPVATGPAVVHQGEEVKIKVLMAAFNSENQPEISASDPNAQITVSDGIGVVTVKPAKGIKTYKGTVTIKNRSGVAKTENWEWKVNVLPK